MKKEDIKLVEKSFGYGIIILKLKLFVTIVTSISLGMVSKIYLKTFEIIKLASLKDALVSDELSLLMILGICVFMMVMATIYTTQLYKDLQKKHKMDELFEKNISWKKALEELNLYCVKIV